MIRKPNDLLILAEKNLEVSQLILHTSNDELLQNITAYHTQQSIENFKTNRALIKSLNKKTIDWLQEYKSNRYRTSISIALFTCIQHKSLKEIYRP